MSLADQKSKVYVIGHPIAHSRSPLIHSYWLDKYELDAVYEKLDVPPQELSAFAASLKAQDNLEGANVTIPHKENVLNLCDDITNTARAIGAVNTIFKRSGQLFGDNTDAYGFIANLDQLAPQWDAGLQNILILGAGGATRGILHGLLKRTKANIFLLNRTKKRADLLAGEFGSQVRSITHDDLASLMPKTDLLINATSIGMKGDAHPDILPELLPKTALVTDIVYTPLETPLLKEAKEACLKTVDGLGMLLHQAVPGFEYWFGIRPEVDEELRALIVDDLKAHGQA